MQWGCVHWIGLLVAEFKRADKSVKRPFKKLNVFLNYFAVANDSFDVLPDVPMSQSGKPWLRRSELRLPGDLQRDHAASAVGIREARGPQRLMVPTVTLWKSLAKKGILTR